MSAVKVRYYANLRDITKCREEIVAGVGNISSLLSTLTGKYGSEFKIKLFDVNSIRENVIILVNGKNIIFSSKLETKLNDEDEVDIFPPVAGG
ncbi:MAG: MoaD/ThiS family protein [Thermoplasmatales archaeon]